MTKTAALPLPLTVTPCRFWHNRNEVASPVILSRLEPEQDLFAVAHHEDPQDVSMSFHIARDGVTLFVYEPQDLTLRVTSDLERNLPRMSIVARYASHDSVIYRHEVGDLLAPPVAVTRSGSDTDLIIGINFDGSSATALPPPDGAYCQLFWRVNSSLRSLRFAPATASNNEPEIPLILRPKREE